MTDERDFELVELPCGKHPIFITEMCVLCPNYDKCYKEADA